MKIEDVQLSFCAHLIIFSYFWQVLNIGIFFIQNYYLMSGLSNSFHSLIFNSPEPKAQGELIVWDSSRCLSVCLCVRPCVHTFKHVYL